MKIGAQGPYQAGSSSVRVGLAPGAAPGTPSSSTSSMPPALADQIASIEEWALSNRSDARRDTLQFWMLKVPAILASASSGVFAYFKLDGIAVIVGAIGGLSVLIDGLNPRGALRNVHLRAFNELRDLENSMASEWQICELRGQDRNLLAAEIIEKSGLEKTRISSAITNAETSLASPPPSMKKDLAKRAVRARKLG